MNTKIKKAVSSLLLMLLPMLLFASDKIPMADVMRSNGKIYVVVAVLVIIFIGIVLFLISLEKKIRKLEKKYE